MTEHEFTGKVAIVAGGSLGMGKASARLFAERGAQVVICGRREQAVREAVAEMQESGLLVEGIPTDVGRSADAEQLNLGADMTALKQLAGATGGTVLTAGQSPFAMNRAATYIQVWPWLTTAALLLFVGEIVGRRFGISLWRRRADSGAYQPKSQNPTMRLA